MENITVTNKTYTRTRTKTRVAKRVVSMLIQRFTALFLLYSACFFEITYPSDIMAFIVVVGIGIYALFTRKNFFLYF